MIFRPEQVIFDYFGMGIRILESIKGVTNVYDFMIEKGGKVIYFDKD